MRRVLVAVQVALLAVAPACGPSAGEVRRAKAVVYQAEFPVVWNAVTEAVRARYPNVVREDFVKGRIVTDWHLVERTSGQELQEKYEAAARGGKFIRLRIAVVGGPPWRVEIEGEAAEYRPGLAMLTPYRRGAPDEPAWVDGRIDRLYSDVYERLERHAVVPAPSTPAKTSAPPAALAALPPSAAEVVAAVHDAARRKDAAALRRHLADPFVGDAGEGPADSAVAIFSADPDALAPLAAAIDGGCEVISGGEQVACPRRGVATRAQARFARRGGVWRLVAFVTQGP